ncbi:DUF5082 family protein [Macrococcus capreoli]
MSKSQLKAELSRLNGQESSLRSTIINDEEDLRKLEQALRVILDEKTEYHSNKSKVDNIDIPSSDWQGNERKKYDEKFETLKSYIETIKTEIDSIITAIESDIRELTAKINANKLSLSNTIARIAVVEQQIRKADD